MAKFMKTWSSSAKSTTSKTSSVYQYDYLKEWPASMKSTTSATWPVHHHETLEPRRRHPGVLPLLCFLSLWHVTLLALGIVVVASAGNGPDEAYAEEFWITLPVRIGMIAVWCPIPFLALIVTQIDLLRLRTWNLKRAAISSAIVTFLYCVATAFWSTCTFIGIGAGVQKVCWQRNGSWEDYVGYSDPMMVRYILPFFAGGTVLFYSGFMILTALKHRRQRRQYAQSQAAYKKNIALVIEEGKPSWESSEIATSSIGEQTLPSRPRSTVPSRQLSMANHSTRPPTYYSSGNDSLLTVSEKDEKDGRTGALGYA